TAYSNNVLKAAFFVCIHGLHICVQDAMFRSSDVDLLINYIRSVKDVATRNHGFYLIASLGKACPQLLSDSIVDLFLVIGDAIKQVSVNILGDISLCSLL